MRVTLEFSDDLLDSFSSMLSEVHGCPSTFGLKIDENCTTAHSCIECFKSAIKNNQEVQTYDIYRSALPSGAMLYRCGVQSRRLLRSLYRRSVMPVNANDARFARGLQNKIRSNGLPYDLLPVDSESNDSHMWYLIDENDNTIFYSGFVHDINIFIDGYLRGVNHMLLQQTACTDGFKKSWLYLYDVNALELQRFNNRHLFKTYLKAPVTRLGFFFMLM